MRHERYADVFGNGYDAIKYWLVHDFWNRDGNKFSYWNRDKRNRHDYQRHYEQQHKRIYVHDRFAMITMDYSRASRENTHTVQRMRMEKSSEKVA
jgi:hypothetical protein